MGLINRFRLFKWRLLGFGYRITGIKRRIKKSETRPDGTVVVEMSDGTVIEVSSDQKTVRPTVPGLGRVNINVDKKP